MEMLFVNRVESPDANKGGAHLVLFLADAAVRTAA